MKLIGWGFDTEFGFGLYWICQNSWTEYWGEDGFVRVYAHEIGLDSAGYSCEPDII